MASLKGPGAEPKRMSQHGEHHISQETDCATPVSYASIIP